ncbi:MAG: hypothetical protein C0497_15560 [Gemmatimonas sp.]|nr:hypothetical protein [Gemmatimonas sp.]
MSVIVLLLIAASLWRPEWPWLDKAALLTLLVGISVSLAVQTDADRERTRRGSWIIPVVAVAVSAQWVYLAPAENRGRTLLLGAALVVAASAIAWFRKRAR